MGFETILNLQKIFFNFKMIRIKINSINATDTRELHIIPCHVMTRVTKENHPEILWPEFLL